MKYKKTIVLKNGKRVCLRSASAKDGESVLRVFEKTHEETDFLLSYPDESTLTVEQESRFLAKMSNSSNEIEMIAVIDDKVVGMAGISPIGIYYKTKHRAEFGVSVFKEYWGQGIGKALTEACIECAKNVGFTQLELEVVRDNVRAISMYEKLGFVEYGSNPKGFNSRVSGYQELVYMRLEL